VFPYCYGPWKFRMRLPSSSTGRRLSEDPPTTTLAHHRSRSSAHTPTVAYPVAAANPAFLATIKLGCATSNVLYSGTPYSGRANGPQPSAPYRICQRATRYAMEGNRISDRGLSVDVLLGLLPATVAIFQGVYRSGSRGFGSFHENTRSKSPCLLLASQGLVWNRPWRCLLPS
jgi:hypothetical protein